MTRTPRRLFCLLTVFLAVLSLSGCFPKSVLPQQEGSLSILGTLGGPELTNIAEAQIVISRGKHVYHKTVPCHDNQFQAELAIPLGEWELTVLLVDQAGQVIYQSTPETVQIELEHSQICEIVLRPADSRVEINIVLGDYVFRNQALRARIHFDDTVYELIRDDPDEPFTTLLTVSPGSYEFKIELFTESFRAGDRLGPGVWQLIEVAPDEELLITWSPATETLTVTGWVELLPGAPTNLQLKQSGDELEISWDPAQGQIEGYFVLLQTDPLERFLLLNPIAVQGPPFLHRFEEELPTEIRCVVAAVSNSGLVGFYSTPAELILE